MGGNNGGDGDSAGCGGDLSHSNTLSSSSFKKNVSTRGEGKQEDVADINAANNMTSTTMVPDDVTATRKPTDNGAEAEAQAKTVMDQEPAKEDGTVEEKDVLVVETQPLQRVNDNDGSGIATNSKAQEEGVGVVAAVAEKRESEVKDPTAPTVPGDEPPTVSVQPQQQSHQAQQQQLPQAAALTSTVANVDNSNASTTGYVNNSNELHRHQEEEERQRMKKRRKVHRMIKRSGGYPSFVSLATADYDAVSSDDEDGDGDFEDREGEKTVDTMDTNRHAIPSAPAGGSDYAAVGVGGNSNKATMMIKQEQKIPEYGYDNDDVFEVGERMPVIIDLDVELGLKERPADSNNNVVVKQEQKVKIESSSLRPVPDRAQSSSSTTAPPPPSSTVAEQALSAADEGWYEGTVRPIALAEDSSFVSEQQQWIRQNLEFFSATDEDVRMISNSKRRGANVSKGRVGVRCVHCAKALLSHSTTHQGEEAGVGSSSAGSNGTSVVNTSNKTWPPGAVSFPNNIAGIHSACSQKPQLHFERNCPHLPPEERARLYALLSSSSSSVGGGGGNQEDDEWLGNNTSRKRRRSVGGIPITAYYIISAKRIGLVDVTDGVRFGRDISLEPLPFETVRIQMQQHQQTMSTVAAAAAAAATLADAGGVMSSSGDASMMVDPATAGAAASTTVVAQASSQPRIKADEESERVLAETVMQPDDPENNLSRSQDKMKVTDYLFLTVRQMMICHAMPMDLSRKKGKRGSVRVGHAGFCCKHCQPPNGLPPTSSLDVYCRSFASAADNLPSSITHSFSNHLQKCPVVPQKLKSALLAYKRLHQRQLAQIPYGSQRRFFHELFARMRKADVSENEIDQRLKAFPQEAIIVATTSPSARAATTHSTTAVESIHADGSDLGDEVIVIEKTAPQSEPMVQGSRILGPSELEPPQQEPPAPEKGPAVSTSAADGIDPPSEYGFLEVAHVYACRSCRAVPVQFRARGSLFFERPAAMDMQHHMLRCKADSFDLEIAAKVLGKFVQVECQEDVQYIKSELFKNLVSECVAGKPELTKIFYEDVRKLVLMRKTNNEDELPYDEDFSHRSNGLWSHFPSKVDSNRVLIAFRAFVKEHSSLSRQLEENVNLVNYLLLISPALELDAAKKNGGKRKSQMKKNQQSS